MTSTIEAVAAPTDTRGMNAMTQANMIPSIHGKPQKARHRASVACAGCRDRRIRCIVPVGETQCSQCKNAGYECIIRYDDERRRPNSKAHTQALTDRITALEKLLMDKGEEIPPVQHPSETGVQNSSAPTLAAPPSEHPVSTEPFYIQESSSEYNEPEISKSDETDGASPTSVYSPGTESIIKRLLSTRGHLSFDQLSGRLRYYGSTTNCHIYSEVSPHQEETSRQMLEQQRRTQKIIRTLSSDTHKYLMELFWQHYNSVLHVVHEAAFNEDHENSRTQFYSGFLHICILAMGFRYADKSRSDIRSICLLARESTLHREAKYMLDCELEQPGGVPTISALLLLGDLECGVGRDNLGWLYAGMANRLCFDIGLHLDNRSSGLSEREIEIGRMTLWACVMYDKYWALYLGRPTSLKSTDLQLYNLTQQFERLGACQPAGPAKSLETRIYEALLDLMELVGKISEVVDPTLNSSDKIDHHAYLRMAALDREFGSWYQRLTQPLQWTAENIATAPFSFFLLHQQYHSAIILLHRPFARYEDSTSALDINDNGEGNDNLQTDQQFSALSRTVCTKHAIRVARIFWQHRQRFDTKLIFVAGMQQAGTAAIALVAALAFVKDPSSRASNMQYLECLAAALQDMAQNYQPAERMSAVLEAVMIELRGTLPSAHQSSKSIVPARRFSSNNDELEDQFFTFKKHQTQHPGSRSKMKTTVPQHPQVRQQIGLVRSSSSTENQSQDTSRSQTDFSDLPRSSFGDFITATSRAGGSNLDAAWPNLNGGNAFSLDGSLSSITNNERSLMSNMSLPPLSDPSTLRSTWMGAETPRFSPPPQNLNTSGFRLASTLSYVDDIEDINGSNASQIEFLRLLNSTEWRGGEI